MHNISYKKISSLRKINLNFKIQTKQHKHKSGIIYTLYSSKSRLIEVGFAQNSNILREKLCDDQFILLDKKEGNNIELNLLKEALKQLGIRIFDNKYYQFTNITIRHLGTLGWPIGREFNKQRKIKKKFSLATN